jgi:hypothetical protein
VLSRVDPFTGEDVGAALIEVADAARDPPRRPSVPTDTPPAAAGLLRACWAADPAARPGFAFVEAELRQLDPLVAGREPERSRREGRDGGTAARAVLEDLFPANVARRLLEGRRVEPETHEMVTVFFADGEPAEGRSLCKNTDRNQSARLRSAHLRVRDIRECALAGSDQACAGDRAARSPDAPW